MDATWSDERGAARPARASSAWRHAALSAHVGARPRPGARRSSTSASAVSSTGRRRRSSWSPTTTTAGTRCWCMAVVPIEPRITWFGPKEADFSRGFKNRVMAFFGGMIPYNPAKTTLTSAVRAVRRVFEADGVLGIFAEGRIGFRETRAPAVRGGRGGVRRRLRRPGRAVRHRRQHRPVVPPPRRGPLRPADPPPMPSAAARPAPRSKRRIRAAVAALLPARGAAAAPPPAARLPDRPAQRRRGHRRADRR